EPGREPSGAGRRVGGRGPGRPRLPCDHPREVPHAGRRPQHVAAAPVPDPALRRGGAAPAAAAARGRVDPPPAGPRPGPAARGLASKGRRRDASAGGHREPRRGRPLLRADVHGPRPRALRGGAARLGGRPLHLRGLNMNENILGPIPERPPRSPWKWVALGCTGLLVACLAFALGIGAFVLGSIRHSGAYELALQRVRASPAVREALGQPIEEGWWVTGSVNVTGPSGTASLSFPVSGP